MIRVISSTVLSDDDEDPFTKDQNEGSSKQEITGKRKCVEHEESSLLTKNLQSLDLDSDDDILIVDTDEESELLNYCPSPVVVPTVSMAASTSKVDEAFKKVFTEIRGTLNTVPDVEEDSFVIDTTGTRDEEDKPPQTTWFRTVGEGDTGMLQCTVSNSDSECENEESDNCHMNWLCTLGLGGVTKPKCSSSADTESINADTIRGLMDVYRKRRTDVLESGGVVATPLHVVKKLAKEHGEGVHLETISYPNGFCRVELFSGTVRGIGEGATKRIAAQMAAIDIIEKVQLSGTSVKVPTAAFLPGWLTSNRIFSDLFALCKSKNLPPPKIKSGANVNENGEVDLKLPPFRAECWLGEDMVTVGESEAEVFAKREAAKEMYALLCNVEYKDTPYAIGRACKRMDELESGGLKPIMSDYKKLWLLQNRVKNKMLTIPEEEEGLDGDCDVKELEKDLDKVENFSIRLMKKNIKVTVNKKFKGDTKEDEKRMVKVEQKQKQQEGMLSEGEESWY